MPKKLVLKKGQDPKVKNLTKADIKAKEERDKRAEAQNAIREQEQVRQGIIQLLDGTEYTQGGDFHGDRTAWALYREKLRELLTRIKNGDVVTQDDLPERPFT